MVNPVATSQIPRPREGEARTIYSRLPGRAVSALAIIAGQLWLIVDDEKLDLIASVQDLITQS